MQMDGWGAHLQNSIEPWAQPLVRAACLLAACKDERDAHALSSLHLSETAGADGWQAIDLGDGWMLRVRFDNGEHGTSVAFGGVHASRE